MRNHETTASTEKLNPKPRVKAPKFAEKNIGPAERHRSMNARQRRYQTCIHESAHVVITFCFNGEMTGDGCYVYDWDDALAGVDDRTLNDEDDAVMTEAGGVAELVWLGHPSRMTKTDFKMWYEFDRQYSPDMGKTDACYRLELAEALRPHDKYGIMGAWNWKAQQMLKDPIIWAAVIGIANALYEEQELGVEEIERIIVLVVQQAQENGFTRPTKYNQALYELSNRPAGNGW